MRRTCHVRERRRTAAEPPGAGGAGRGRVFGRRDTTAGRRRRSRCALLGIVSQREKLVWRAAGSVAHDFRYVCRRAATDEGRWRARGERPLEGRHPVVTASEDCRARLIRGHHLGQRRLDPVRALSGNFVRGRAVTRDQLPRRLPDGAAWGTSHLCRDTGGHRSRLPRRAAGRRARVLLRGVWTGAVVRHECRSPAPA